FPAAFRAVIHVICVYPAFICGSGSLQLLPGSPITDHSSLRESKAMLAGKAVMINWSDVAPEHRPAYYEWHSREHMVGRVTIPGYQRGRRYLAAQAQRDFLVMYEVDDLAVVTGADYLAKANKPSPLTQRTTQYVRNAVRGLALVKVSFGIGTGGYA